jgi:UbiD family decarboxylase
VRREVDPDFEIAAILEKAGAGPAFSFDRVKGFPRPVVANLMASRANIARQLGIDEPDLLAALTAAVEHGVAPVIVDAPPCQEVVSSAIDLPALLPIGRMCADEGTYITSGLTITRDLDTGVANVSISRALLLGHDRLVMGIATRHHMYQLAARAWKSGRTLPFAIAIGNHTATVLAAVAEVPLGSDEYEIAGALLKEPLRLARCRTVDVHVPAEAELIIEAELRPNEVYDEGPTSEFSGVYVNYGEAPVARVTGVTHRRDFIYQNIANSRVAEHMLLGGVLIEATLFQRLRELFPCVADIRVTLGGCGRLHAVIAVRNPKKGEGRRLACAAVSLVNLIKHVVVVDDDVNLDDPHDVEWALATRFRPERDIMVIPGVMAYAPEPVQTDGVSAKWMLIALRDPDLPAADYRRARAPDAVIRRVAEQWDSYFKP